MTGPGLVLAAHGAGQASPANRHVIGLAAQFRHPPFSEVTPAFHLGEPRFCEVLDRMTAREVLVVPFLAADGYFAGQVLPRELALNRRFAAVNVTICRPIGCDESLAELAARRVAAISSEYRTEEDETAVIVVGHGTLRDAASRRSTEDLVGRMRVLCAGGNVRCAFLDEPPSIEDVLAAVKEKRIVIIPHFMAPGPHVQADLPRRIGFNPDAPSGLPRSEAVTGKVVVCDDALGVQGELIEIITRRANEFVRDLMRKRPA